MNSAKLLIDSDVVRHLCSGGVEGLLGQLYPGRVFILDIVEQELKRSKRLISVVDRLIGDGLLVQMDFPQDSRMLQEFARLKSIGRGEGESACMAVARYSKDTIASSNLRDIHHYCKMHQISFLTTMDILLEAFTQKVLSEADCDLAIQKILTAGSKLPVRKIRDYTPKK